MRDFFFALCASAAASASASAFASAFASTSEEQSLFCGLKLRHFAQCNAWHELYDSTDGRSWHHCANSRDDPCECDAVTCSDGEITRIRLDDYNLKGQMPSSIGSISTLTRLSLQNNSLGGQVPEIFDSMPALENVDLSYNRFTGTIPHSLGSLRNAKKLLMRDNELTGTLPTSLAMMTKVEEFNFRSNRLTGTIPQAYGALTEVANFILYENQLTGAIPDFFSNFTKLKFMRFDHNSFNGSIPPSLANCCPEMITMQVNCNALSGAVPDFHFDQFTRACGIGGPAFDRCLGGYVEHNRFDCPLSTEAYRKCNWCNSLEGYRTCPASCEFDSRV